MNQDLKQLKTKKLFLLDMDGTLYLDHQLIDGTIPFLDTLKKQNKRGIYVTNNSSKSVIDYVKKLSSLGIDSTEKDFYTSSMATARYLNEFHFGKTVYCMGTASLKEELNSKGIKIAKDKDDFVDVVLIGYDTELTSQKLYDVCWLLKQDLPYIATNPDYVCPVEFGFVPDCGSFADMIYNATKKRPIFIGKPHPRMIEYAIEASGYSKKDAVIIGDRLYTDILSGINANITTICVLSGETTLKDIQQSDIKPDFILDSIQTVYDIIKA
jgi:HAD superfamily hydrolase (TIGR01457 family)